MIRSACALVICRRISGGIRYPASSSRCCATTIATDLRTAGVTTIRTEAELTAAGALPTWLGDEDFHRSHQSSLLRKDPDFYGPQFPGVPDDLEYVWPVRRIT